MRSTNLPVPDGKFSFWLPHPLPLASDKISGINNLAATIGKIPRKIFITKTLQVKILKARDLDDF